jgi:hypothetical protein
MTLLGMGSEGERGPKIPPPQSRSEAAEIGSAQAPTTQRVIWPSTIVSVSAASDARTDG